MKEILHGDSLEVMKTLETDSVDLVCTDPPYGIGFMGKEWDTFTPDYQAKTKERESKRAPRQDGRTATGFQEATYAGAYDNSLKGHQGFQNFIHTHALEWLRVLKPGSFIFMTMSPRQDVLSRAMIALEDAGFNTGFTSMYWTFASGFPKAMNIGKMVDKRTGTKREVLRTHTQSATNPHTHAGSGVIPQIASLKNEWNITAATSPEAKALEGSYGGFQPKPAVEVIIVAMKPLSEKTFVNQALKNGKGISWLDDCRVPTIRDIGTLSRKPSPLKKGAISYLRNDEPLLGGTEHNGGRFPANLLVSDDVLNDSSRYFDLDAWAKTLPFLIVAKASKREKNNGLGERDRKTVSDGPAVAPDNAFQRGKTERKNTHPTVKPLKLMSYLITLGSRPGDVVLDPFAGSCTTGVAAKNLGRKSICIEREQEYVNICEARMSNIPDSLWEVEEIKEV